jgi:hypothetical protein
LTRTHFFTPLPLLTRKARAKKNIINMLMCEHHVI